LLRGALAPRPGGKLAKELAAPAPMNDAQPSRYKRAAGSLMFRFRRKSLYITHIIRIVDPYSSGFGN
jgi:hypothetical protein